MVTVTGQFYTNILDNTVSELQPDFFFYYLLSINARGLTEDSMGYYQDTYLYYYQSNTKITSLLSP